MKRLSLYIYIASLQAYIPRIAYSPRILSPAASDKSLGRGYILDSSTEGGGGGGGGSTNNTSMPCLESYNREKVTISKHFQYYKHYLQTKQMHALLHMHPPTHGKQLHSSTVSRYLNNDWLAVLTMKYIP